MHVGRLLQQERSWFGSALGGIANTRSSAIEPGLSDGHRDAKISMPKVWLVIVEK